MSRLPPSANIHFDETGLIQGDDFGDSYFSRDDGLAESRAVFLAGNHLPTAWAGRDRFVIGELGFGTGLNVLAAWDLWNKTASATDILHIISVEGFLMDADSAQTAHRGWPELAPLSQQLIARWPTRAAGTQRIWFPKDRLCITFLIGPCVQMLSRMDFQVDAWFLDGFSPSKNPDMWSPAVFAQVRRLSAPEATVATYSVAGIVRSGLTEVGYDVLRAPGFGSKRERLEARLLSNEPPKPTPARPKTALVIGGGIGGSAACAALIRRGIKVELIDGDPCARTKASGNPLALIMPRLDRGDTREAWFFRSAYLMACDAYGDMGDDGFETTGVIECGEDAKSLERLADLGFDPPLPDADLAPHGTHGLLHRRAGVVYPHAVLKYLRVQAAHHPVTIGRLEQKDGHWRALTPEGKTIAQADICIIAAGTGINLLCDLGPDLLARAGQLSLAKIEGALPETPLSGGAYAARFGDRLAFGATFEPWPLDNQTPPPVSAEKHSHNQANLAEIAPDLAARIDLQSAHGRASIRVTTNDNLPVVGAVPDAPTGLFVLAALASRGFTTAFLCAEMIASQACHEPSPVERDVALALAPDRFIKRRAKRATAS
jgi:tRNA 5-methylaminomethyl-2-thiouridine biosynthesis bifunctional protein